MENVNLNYNYNPKGKNIKDDLGKSEKENLRLDYESKIKKMKELLELNDEYKHNEYIASAINIALNCSNSKMIKEKIEKYKEDMKEIAFNSTGGIILQVQYEKFLKFWDNYLALEKESNLSNNSNDISEDLNLENDSSKIR